MKPLDLSILDYFTLDCNEKPIAPKPEKPVKVSSIPGDFNGLIYNYHVHHYIKHLRAKSLALTYIKNSKAILIEYAQFLRNQRIQTI